MSVSFLGLMACGADKDGGRCTSGLIKDYNNLVIAPKNQAIMKRNNGGIITISEAKTVVNSHDQFLEKYPGTDCWGVERSTSENDIHISEEAIKKERNKWQAAVEAAVNQ